MKSQSQELKQTIEWLMANGFGDLSFANGDADLYLTNVGVSPRRIDDISQFNSDQVVFFGTLQ